MRALVVVGLLLAGALHQSATAQARNNWWALDWNDVQWLDFGAAEPPAVVPRFPGSDGYYGFHGTLSDTSGTLVLFTRIQGVRNGLGQVVPGPSALWATNMACMGSALAPAHGASRYGVFLTLGPGGFAHPAGGGFAEVDMDLNGGAGLVLGTGGRLLVDSVQTSVAVAPHGNGTDYWGIFHAWATNTWYAYQYGPSGLDTVPVVSMAGAVHQATGTISAPIKCSPTNDRIAIHSQGGDTLSVLEFDPDLGTLTELVDLVVPASFGILEFSPSGRYLYALSNAPDSTRVLQWDLWQPPGLIPASGTTVFATPTSISYLPGGMLLAPDGRIYFPQAMTSFLSRIADPDRPGTLCDVQVNAVDIAPGELTTDIPNHCKWYHDDPITLGSAELVGDPELTVWPNPAAFTTNVQLPEHNGPWTVQVIDGLGRVVHASTARQGGQVLIPTAGWPPGSYVVRAQGTRANLSAKLVVCH